MKELKRIFSNRRLMLGLLLIFLINGILFYNAQTERDFGLDLSGPSSGMISMSFGGSFEGGQAKADGAESYAVYQNGWQNTRPYLCPKRRKNWSRKNPGWARFLKCPSCLKRTAGCSDRKP